MNYTFTINVDDIEDLKIFVRTYEVEAKVDEAVQFMRTQMKHGDLNEKEYDLLEKVREILWYE